MTNEYIGIGAAVVAVITLILVIWLFFKLGRMDRIRKEFSFDEITSKADDMIVKHNQKIKELGQELQSLGEYVESLAAANKKNYQKVGFVRFNPFGDTGGSISFVLALLDADNNGFVVSSLHGREGNRVYAKEVTKGTSKSQLTEEEIDAIKSAK
jgi:hypothetical protein